jgi:hypothetical protein
LVFISVSLKHFHKLSAEVWQVIGHA